MRFSVRLSGNPEEVHDQIAKTMVRAIKCDLKLVEVFDESSNWMITKRLIFDGARWSIIRYFGKEILTGNIKMKDLPRTLLFMFM